VKRSGFRAGMSAVALIGCVSCGGGPPGRAAVAPPAAQPPTLGDATLDSPNLRVQLLEVTRVGPELLAVTLAITNRDQAGAVTLGTTFSAAPADFDSLADVYLIDDAREKRYFVLRDARGRVAGSQGIGAIEPGGRRVVWARFAGPPAGVKQITVQVPHLQPFRNVTIAESAVRDRPTPAGTARPGPSY
jgi:hypothetical protein